jgi:type IV pilus assembly protein PilA
MHPQRGRPGQGGFTLVELLVVILVVGILIALAAPSFLGQTDKAKDSAAQQALAVVYKNARAAATSHEGSYPAPTALASALALSEPGYDISAARCPTIAAEPGPHKVVVSPVSSAQTLVAFARSASGKIAKLTASTAGPSYALLEGCPSYWTTVKSTSGLVGYWRLGDATGTAAAAKVGTALDYTNTPTLGVAGAVDDSDTAVAVDGSQWAETPFTTALNPASFSVELWAYGTPAATLAGHQKVFASSLDTAAKRGYELGISGDEAYFLVGTGASYRSTTGAAAAFSYDAWHQVVATYDAGAQRMQLYLDGAPVAAMNGVAALPVIDPTISFYAGRTSWTTSYNWVGRLDELSVYQSVLSPEQVAEHFSAAQPGGQ